jgi:hypothetical protein
MITLQALIFQTPLIYTKTGAYFLRASSVSVTSTLLFSYPPWRRTDRIPLDGHNACCINELPARINAFSALDSILLSGWRLGLRFDSSPRSRKA